MMCAPALFLWTSWKTKHAKSSREAVCTGRRPRLQSVPSVHHFRKHPETETEVRHLRKQYSVVTHPCPLHLLSSAAKLSYALFELSYFLSFHSLCFMNHSLFILFFFCSTTDARLVACAAHSSNYVPSVRALAQSTLAYTTSKWRKDARCSEHHTNHCTRHKKCTLKKARDYARWHRSECVLIPMMFEVSFFISTR